MPVQPESSVVHNLTPAETIAFMHEKVIDYYNVTHRDLLDSGDALLRHVQDARVALATPKARWPNKMDQRVTLSALADYNAAQDAAHHARVLAVWLTEVSADICIGEAKTRYAVRWSWRRLSTSVRRVRLEIEYAIENVTVAVKDIAVAPAAAESSE